MIPTSVRRHSKIVLAIAIAATAAPAQVAWTQLATSGAPSPECGSCWDEGRSRLVAFGGRAGGVETSSMREWNGTNWLSVNATPRPSARTRPAMGYDAARAETVLFGGGATPDAQTWTYNGTSWTQRFPASSPTPRQGAAMAWDPIRQVLVMFGGFVPSGNDSDEVWEWNGTTWTQRPTLVRPPRRGAHRMAWHAGLAAVVMVGGYSTPLQSTLSDTWSWDGTTWTQRASLPTTVCDQVLAYEPTRQRLVQFGGLIIQNGTFTDLDDTYEFGGTWQQRVTTPSPAARDAMAGAYDPVNDRVVIAGGQFGGNARFDTWSYSLTQPATAISYGMGCAVTQGLQLEIVRMPYAGLPFEQRLSTPSPGAAIGLIVFGSSNTSYVGLPLPLDLSAIGALACSLLTSADFVATVPLSNGVGTHVWNIPSIASAIGFPFYTQGAAIDLTSPLPFPLDMSSGYALTVGNP